MNQQTVQRMADRAEIADCMTRYSRGVDRGDWDLVRSTYHGDAYDSHGDYKGDIPGLIGWLDQRFAGVDNSMHFLGNCLIEFASPDLAFVETYFVSRRLRSPTAGEAATLQEGDALCREAWGRYLDHFERRDGEWRVASRAVVLEASYTSVAIGGQRRAGPTWGRRDSSDLVNSSRAELFAKAAGGP